MLVAFSTKPKSSNLYSRIKHMKNHVNINFTLHNFYVIILSLFKFEKFIKKIQKLTNEDLITMKRVI